MLNWNRVMFYIKGRLSLPSSFIEKSEGDIKKWVEEISLPEFSNYFPDTEYTSVLPNNENYRVPGRPNYFRFFDEEELPIYGIKECYFSSGDQFITGHPPFGALSFSSMKWWALDVFKSRFFYPFSHWHQTYKFISPNMVHVLSSGHYVENFAVYYEREQPHDLRKIPASMTKIFMDLALSDVMIWIGGIRSNYGDGRLSTPFGEIPLNGETLKSEGNELKREAMEKLIENSIPPIIVDIE